MKTRLNKTMIDEIIKRVIKDTTIPAEIKALEKELYDRATACARQLVPPVLLELTKQYPREWFNWASQILVPGGSHRRHPLEPLGVYAFKNVDIESTPTVNGGRCAAVPMETFDDIRARAETIAQRRLEITNELRLYLLSRRTVEAAVRDMPELEKHMPVKSSTPGALVAASNVMSKLTASGFSVSESQQKA